MRDLVGRTGRRTARSLSQLGRLEPAAKLMDGWSSNEDRTERAGSLSKVLFRGRRWWWSRVEKEVEVVPPSRPGSRIFRPRMRTSTTAPSRAFNTAAADRWQPIFIFVCLRERDAYPFRKGRINMRGSKEAPPMAE